MTQRSEPISLLRGRMALGTVVVLAAGMGGCAAQAPIVAWQESLTQYVEREGGGDPAILRETVDLRSRRSLRPGRVTFAASGIFSGAACWRLHDVTGVLVDVSTEAERTWYIFLVGVRCGRSSAGAQVEDVRAVAMWAEPGGLCWRVGLPDPDALEQYRQTPPAVRLVDADSHVCAERFPRDTDVFHGSTSAGVVTITETGTGAAWCVALGEPGSRPVD